MKKKSIRNYYMNLNGFAYDPFEKGGSVYVVVANLRNETSTALFCIVNGYIRLVSSTMPQSDLLQVGRDLSRNVDIVLEGLPNA